MSEGVYTPNMNDDAVTRPDHIVALYSKVNQYRVGEDYCDVEIIVEGRVFKCHRLILAAGSEYFHIMFGGKFKESTAYEVTLSEIEAATFEEILRLVYTGNVTINNANLFKLLRAGEFFRLPRLEELCLRYLRRNTNEIIENGLEMLSYIRSTGKTNFGQILCQYVHKNFDYFSKTPEFLEMSSDDFISILDLIPSASPSTLQDVFMLAIVRWIRHTDHSPRDRRSHFNNLLQRISFSKLSSDCVEYLTRRHFEDFIAFSGSAAAANGTPLSCLHATDSEVEEVVDFARLHVYVNAYPADDHSRFVTNVFTLYKQFDEQKWVNSYKFDGDNSYDIMRTVVLDTRLYCLGYSRASLMCTSENVQTFRTSSSISLFSNNTHLKLPPLILDKYDMCGFDKRIYLYNKNCSINAVITKGPNASSFTDEQLCRDVFLYDREVDTWLPLPPPKGRFANACMTCDGQIVYLIGGTDSNGYVQCYDHRTPSWLSLSRTYNVFEESACCAHRNKIYVSGGRQNPSSVEMYDPTAGKWKEMSSMKQNRSNHYVRPFMYSKRFLVAAGGGLSQNLDVEFYNTLEDKWYYMSSLYSAVVDSDLSDNSFKILDMVSYKPFGL